MSALPHPDNFRFDAAQGWLMLGDATSAAEELDSLTPDSRMEPDVLEFEWALLAKTESWKRAVRVAEELIERAPGRAVGWVHRAYALRRMPGGGLRHAWAALLPATERFPKLFLIPYNLACYAAQMGDLEEAWEWYERAEKLEEKPGQVRGMALVDPDLVPIHPRLGPKK